MNDIIEISTKEVEQLIIRIEAAIAGGESISNEDLAMLLNILRCYAHLNERVANNDITITKLKKLFGVIATSRHESKSEPVTQKPAPPPQTPHAKKSSDEFSEAEVVHHPHQRLKKGDPCPECQNGRLYKFEPAQFVRIHGEAPFQASIHVIEQLRCNLCQTVFKAEVSDELSRDGPLSERYGYSAKALMAILRFGAGSPMFRQSSLQKMFKVPISASTIWDQIEACANALRPIFMKICELAADGTLIFNDDTSNKILSLEPVMRKNRKGSGERLRTGVHTSGLVSVLEDGREIILYKTGINHAGEFIDRILEKRTSKQPFMHMSDALSANVATSGVCIKAYCNAHARRQFEDIEHQFPDEVAHVLSCYKEIYRNETDSKKLKMNQSERLEYHKTHSLPVMEELLNFCQKKLDDREAEPNSPLGAALNYFIKHYGGLVAFCHHEGCPLDNNKQEQKLKLIVLHRKNSLFFKEPTGAAVSDVITSLCATAASAEINVLEYFTDLMRNASQVRAHPEHFLPWGYTPSLH